ncbi:iron ABC transporter permease [Acinetobacter albensis]|jgi:iron complex transport system permease protein|uniref:FecCD family ABC transporter permease n=1 Tax=Acinetobacter albensis TaxID=1673609 RepID=UPI001882CEB9|nr:iron ABC transporter permease [Acinetobacter albensis]MBE9402135.1 iron ABC transporter permease [Acinetobacter albensis]
MKRLQKTWLPSAYTTNLKPILALLVGSVLLIIFSILSLSIGHEFIPPLVVFDSFHHYDPLNLQHILVQTTRLSRTVLALIIGACLAVAGALMQALTRNPLASPSLFGINAGAMFSIVIFSSFFSLTRIQDYMYMAMFGATIAGCLVYFLGTAKNGQLHTLKFVLAGAAISALFTALTQAMLVIDQESLDSILFWLAGSISDRQLNVVSPLFPFLGLGLLFSLLLALPINILMAGEEIAKSLGQRTVLLQIIMGIIVILLAGGSVAIAGSIAFVGLIVPHIVRLIVSKHYQWLLPGCIIYGALLLVISDLIARVIIFPQEIPIGVMTALLGGPVFIYLIRQGMRHG